MSLGSIVSGFEKKADKIRRAANKRRKSIQNAAQQAADQTRRTVEASIRVVPKAVDPLDEVGDFGVAALKRVMSPFGERKEPYKPYAYRPAEKRTGGNDLLRLAGKGLEEYQTRIGDPLPALAYQLITKPGKGVGSVLGTNRPIFAGVEDITGDVSPGFDFGGGGKAGAFQDTGDFVNPFKAVYSEEEQAKAHTVLSQADPVTATMLRFALDLGNVFPVVGFGPELSTLIKTVRKGGPESLEALRVLMSNPKLKEEFVGGMKNILLSERGAIRLGGAADEGAEAARLAKVADLRKQADEIQNVMGFGEKQKLQQLGIDPNAIDQPEVMAKLVKEAPEMLDENPELAAFAQRVGESLIKEAPPIEPSRVVSVETVSNTAFTGPKNKKISIIYSDGETAVEGIIHPSGYTWTAGKKTTGRAAAPTAEDALAEAKDYFRLGRLPEAPVAEAVPIPPKPVGKAGRKGIKLPQGIVPYVEPGKLAVVAPRAAERVFEEATLWRTAGQTLTQQVADSGGVVVPRGEEAIQLAQRSFSSRAKEMAAAGAQDEIRNIVREEGDIKRRLAAGLASPEETQGLHDALSLLSVRKNGLREDMNIAAQTASDIATAAAKRRAEVRAAGAAAAKAKITRPTGFSHKRITDAIPTLDTMLDYAFGPATVQRKVASVLANTVGSPIKYLDKSLIHENSFIGKYYVAFQQLAEAIETSRELGLRAIRGYGDSRGVKVFDLTEEGIELTTGKEISDVIENWDTYKHLFNDEQAGFVDLYNRFRLDVLEDAKSLGVYIPDAWKDIFHVWRQARGKRGVSFQRAMQSGASTAKPPSFKHRIYETLEAGRVANIDYNKDFTQVIEAGALSISHHAVNKAFWNALTKKAPLISRFVPAQLKAERAVAAKNYIWARQVKNYVHESLRGRPPMPILRDAKDVKVPTALRQIVEEAAQHNRTKLGKLRSTAVRPYASKIDEITEVARQAHRTKNAKVQYAVERLSKKQVPGQPFGLDGMVEVGMASPSKFPMLQNRLFLQEDLDYLLKIWDSDPHKLWGAAAQTADVFRAGATALDPGFWFTHGLGAIGTDMANLASGRPSAIWGKSAWRSMRNAVTNSKSANRYWARELELHPDEVSEFGQYYRSLSGHAMPSEFTVAMEKGGWIEKAERTIPGLKQLQPFTRASNAFSFYLDSFAWETWKALRPLAGDDPKKLTELGQFIRNITGKTSTRGLGHSQMQRLAERSVVAWAPAYTRGAFAIMGKALLDPTSFGGRQALKSLAGLGAATTLMGGAFTMAKQLNEHNGDFSKLEWDEMGEDMKSFWNVLEPSKFMSIRSGDNYYGVGGAMRSNIAMIVRMAKAGYADPTNYNPLDIESGHFINFDHPFLRAWRAKASPLTGQAFNLITGEDYLGVQLDDPAQYLRLSEDISPFAMQAFLQAEGGLKGKIGAATAEWFGFRSFPLRKVDLYHEAAETEAGREWEQLDAEGQLSLMRDDPEQFPETAKRWQEYQEELRIKGSESQKARDVASGEKEKRDTELGTLAGNIQWGRPGGGQFYKDQRPVKMATYRNAYDVAAATLGIDLDDLEKTEAKDEMLRSQYYELNVEDFLGPDNKPDWDTFNAEKDRLFEQLSPEAQRAVKAKQLDYDDPVLVQTEKRRLQATEDLEKWFDYPKYNGLTVEESDQVDKLLEEASKIKEMAAVQGKSVDRRDILKAMLTSGTVDPKIAAPAYLLTYSHLSSLVKNPAADNWALSHPDLSVFYPFIFDSLSEEQQLEWTRLHSFRK